MNKLKLFFVLVVFSLSTTVSFAGFPLGKGGYELIPSYTFYKATSYWDKTGLVNSFPSGGYFTSNYFSIYGGFGLNRDWDFIFNVPYVVQTYSTGTNVTQTAGLGDAKVGLCYYLNHYDNYKHLGLTGSLILPLYQNQADPVIGFASTGLEAKLGLAGNSQMSIRNAYYDIEAGIRQYFDVSGPTQYFADITGGKQMSDQWKISGTLRGVVSSSSNNSVNLTQNLNKITLNRDFSYLRASISLAYIVSPNTSIWGSLFKDISGRNTGIGSGLQLFLVYKL